jgi:mRNA interferase YafQ
MKGIQKSGRKKSDFLQIKWIIDQLAVPAILPASFRDHSLSGKYKDYRECHIFPDLLLIYFQDEDNQELRLYRIGSHSELFR